MTDCTLDCTRAEYEALAAGPRPVVARTAATLAVDVDPLSAYAALTEGEDASPYSFLLESAEKVASSDPAGAFATGGERRHARYSFVGYDPDAAITLGPDGASLEALTPAADTLDPPRGADVLDTLRSILPDVRLAGFDAGARKHLAGGLVGFLSYDAVYDLWLEEVGFERPASRFPDATFVLTTKTLIFDHAEGRLSLVFTPILQTGDDPGETYRALERETRLIADRLAGADPVAAEEFRGSATKVDDREPYEAAVRRAKEAVAAGEIYQGVLSRGREHRGAVDTRGFYQALRDINPSPYMYLLEFDGISLVGASPETLVSVDGDRVVANPIAGTCARGSSPVEDRRLAGEMLADEKERAEHTMLVDLARNDIRRVATPGSVRVPEFMTVRKYAHVQHIESTVIGDLAADADAFDAIRATFPAGTLSGAPKIRAMELIDELETAPRGPYGGGVGYVSWTGDADVAITIRSAIVEHGETDRLTLRAGAGIVADSDPAGEYEETVAKMDGVREALDRLASQEATEPTGPAVVEEGTE